MAGPRLPDRLRLLARAALGLFSDQSMQAAFGLLSGLYPGTQGATPERTTRHYLTAYSTMPWLRAVTARIAGSVAATAWKVLVVRKPGQKARRMREIQQGDLATRKAILGGLRRQGEVEELGEHPFLTVLDSANSFLTGLMLRKLTQLYVDLVGEAFWLKERNTLGATVGAWPLPPDWVQQTPTPANRFYRVASGGWRADIPDTEILWFTDPDPANPYGRGSGTAKALADELEADEWAARHTKATFINRARPDLLITAMGVRAPELRRLEEEWNSRLQGFLRAGKPMFVSQDVKVQEIGENFRSLQLVQLRQFERDTIIQVFGLPPEILGVLESSNRATIDAASFIFANWILVPRLEFLRSIFQERLLPEYDDRLIVEYASPVQEDQQFRLDTAKAAPWSLTVDEWRGLIGEPPLPDGQGTIFYVPTGLQALALGAMAGAKTTGCPLTTAGWDLRKLSESDLVTLAEILARA